MKIIQVVGRSNSGKTTFIRKLIPALKRIGPVGVIKHLGDHAYQLEPGKDTTHFYNAGADITTGIDAEKAVSIVKDDNLERTLHHFLRSGMDFAVIEGYKQKAYAKIVIGNLEIGNCVLTNPTTDEVIRSLHLFNEFK